jgi:drug/metabolite transporter (DMT)-like permease
MLPAFLATCCLAFAMIFAARSSQLIGGAAANFGRLVLALILLAIWAHGFGEGLAGKSLPWFLLSGVIGFGLGDIAMFLALPRIGPRLTVLLVQCLAAPFGALTERFWLGTELHSAQIACGAVILAGVALAVAPQRHVDAHRRGFSTGVFLGVLAALGQGLGAVISRKAYAVAANQGLHIDGETAAYQRLLGGILIAAVFLAATHSSRSSREKIPKGNARRALPWLILHALSGPVIGIGCYQWALATAPSGVVLPIVATTPVVTIPLAWMIDGDRPSARSVIGGLIAVAGTIALMRV